jgi:hypothetical protein
MRGAPWIGTIRSRDTIFSRRLYHDLDCQTLGVNPAASRPRAFVAAHPAIG